MTEKECRFGKWVNYREAREFLFEAKDILKKYNISLSDTLNLLEDFCNSTFDLESYTAYISLNENNKIELYTGVVFGDKKYEL